jgi:NitT/TauT family transport system permease protein
MNGVDTAQVEAPAAGSARARHRPLSLRTIWSWRIAVAIVFIAGWQWLPDIPGASSRVALLNPIFISSPWRTVKTLAQMTTGSNGEPLLWSYLGGTIEATLLGTVIGLILGAGIGLLFSHYETLSVIARPFVVGINSIPRIALIPIVILVVGVGRASDVVNAVLIVFFIGFYSALEGGLAVPKEVLDNAALLKASNWQVMWYIRRPYVVGWTFAVVPNAVSFGLIASVTSEILAGNGGMGYLISQSTTNLDASLAFAVIVSLSIVGMILTFGADKLRQKVSPWASYH